MIKIPFNRPCLQGKELAYIRDAVRRGHLSGDGYYTERCQDFLTKKLDAASTLLTPSCTHALELAFLLLDLQPGDEVIVPTYTFSSSANAFVLRGLIPKFIDSRPDTLNLDDQVLDDLVTPRTRAMVPVHYAGVPCPMDRIMSFAKRHRLYVIEDSAQALNATFRGRPAGSFGDLNAISFHETKNCQCGEGGALAIREDSFVERAKVIRQKGTNRDRFLRGEVDKYTWIDTGSSYVPSELQSAYLYAQLQALPKIHDRRRALYERYAQALAPAQRRGDIQLPVIPADCTSSYHLFHVLFASFKERERVRLALLKKGILAVTHYAPLHLSQMGQSYGYRKGQFPVAERAGDCLLRLPLYNDMTRKEQDQVLRALQNILTTSSVHV